MRFTVGLKTQGRSDHIVLDAEDALVAALKAKIAHPQAQIMYVRRANRRGDARHPPHRLPKESEVVANQGKIRVGIGGWTFEPWRGTFYPKGLPHARELQ